jgi:hypothetical protein
MVDFNGPKSSVIIMITAAGYEAVVIRPLIESIERCSPSARVVVFVDRIRPTVRSLIAQTSLRIDLVPFPFYYRWFHGLFKNRYRFSTLVASFIACFRNKTIWKLLAEILQHPATYRFIAYRKWINRNLIDQDIVWMIDARDVLITDDLTKVDVCRVVVGEELNFVKDEIMNLSWLILAGYEISRVADISRQKIICSGVVGGVVFEVKRFLETYEAEVIDHIGVIANRFGGDQPVVMMLARTGSNSYSFDVQPYESSILVNLGTSAYGNQLPSWVEAPTGGSPLPKIIHQYDRIPEVKEFLKAKHGLG